MHFLRAQMASRGRFYWKVSFFVIRWSADGAAAYPAEWHSFNTIIAMLLLFANFFRPFILTNNMLLFHFLRKKWTAFGACHRPLPATPTMAFINWKRLLDLHLATQRHSLKSLPNFQLKKLQCPLIRCNNSERENRLHLMRDQGIVCILWVGTVLSNLF